MKKVLFLAVVVCVCLLVILVFGGVAGRGQVRSLPGTMPDPGGISSSGQLVPKVQTDWGRMPLYFIPNKGQMDERVSFYIQGQDKTIYFAPGEVTFSLSKPPDKTKDKAATFPDRPGRRRLPPSPTERWTVKLEFVGADMKVKPVAEDKTGAVISYFKGQEKDWKTGLETYSRIVYRNLWPGIDLAYSGTVNRLKYEFIVHPGADPSTVRLRYQGAKRVAINSEGLLEVVTPIASITDDRPIAWQEVGGVRKGVGMSYDLAEGQLSSGSSKSQDLGFKVGKYDPSLPLILDPCAYVYCGYVGGSLTEDGNGICVDSSGSAYITGQAQADSIGFPVTVGPDLVSSGNYDAFVAKINSSGTGLIYCGYIGGGSDDWGTGIAVNSAGNAFVGGMTWSDEGSFPVVGGPDLTYNGTCDGFIAKVNVGGSGLIYCGYIGGDSADGVLGVAVDSLGRALVCGATDSSEATFPVRTGPDLTYNGSGDAFVAKINASGTSYIYCGYIGGSARDSAQGIAVDSSGNIAIAGVTQSTEATFPVHFGPDLTSNGGWDAFVAKINAAGTTFLFCGYIGGAADDYGNAVALDRTGNLYVGGQVVSDESSFPTLVGPDLAFGGGTCDSFVAKVYSSGIGLAYCGYIGGADWETLNGIAVDSRGCAYVVGATSSDQSTFPVRGGPGLVYGGYMDAFVARVGATGRGLSYCTYVGGGASDRAMGIAVGTNCSAYITGFTQSTESGGFPVLTGPDLSHNGEYDAFVAKIRLIPELTLITPVGGELWVVGSIHKIEWTSEDTKGYNKIELSTDKGQTWSTIAASTPDDGSFKWLVPNKPSVACLVRITQKESGQWDMSDQPFTIDPKPAITVVSPNGGEVWSVYDQRTIQWTTQGTVGDVKIEYSTNGGTTWKVVTASTPNTGSYMWVVPNMPSTKCLVRIKEASDGSPADKSKAVFTIK